MYGQIFMKLDRQMEFGKRNNRFSFGTDPDLIQNTGIFENNKFDSFSVDSLGIG